MAKRQQNFWKKLGNRYVFSVRNQSHFEESARATLSINEVISLLTLFLMVMLLLAYVLFQYSPLAYFVGGESPKNKKALLTIANRSDSLEQKLLKNELYYAQISKVLNGEVDVDSIPSKLDSNFYKTLQITEPSEEELELREKIEEQEKFAFSPTSQTMSNNYISPLEGVISSKFDYKKAHFGVDVVAPKGSPVKAIAKATVIYAGWSSENGNTIILSHPKNVISIYNHNEKLLKETGDLVLPGEAIALIGNTGKNSSGYHLHFELWENSTALDPETYFKFN